MLKILFWLLLLVNAVLFMALRGVLDPILPDTHEPQRLQQQVSPERMRILPVALPAAPPPPVVVATPVPARLACVELGDFSEAEAVRFDAGVNSLGLTVPATHRRITEGTSHIVFIPSQIDKDGAERKSAELRRLGVKDFFVLQTAGEMHYAISLGVFKSRQAADAHLAELMRQGVRSARVGAYGSTTTRVAVQLRELDEAGLAAALKLAAMVAKVGQRECVVK